MRSITSASIVCLLFVGSIAVAENEKATGADYALATKFSRDFVYELVQEARVSPTFIGKTDQFWYGIRTPKGTKYFRVDPTRKLKEPLFDAAKLAAQLSESVQKPIDTDTLRITRVTVTDDGAKMRFVYDELQFEYELATTKLTKLGKAAPPPRTFPKGNMDERMRQFLERQRQERERCKRRTNARTTQKKDDVEKKESTGRGRRGRFGGPGGYKASSPDRKRYVFARSTTCFWPRRAKNPRPSSSRRDGEEDYSFSSSGRGFGGRQGVGRTTRTESKIPTSDRKTRPNVTWSPDSKCFFVTRIDSRGIKELFLVNPLVGAAADAGHVQVPHARRRRRPPQRIVLLRRRQQEDHQGQSEMALRNVHGHPLEQIRRRTALHPPRSLATAPPSLLAQHEDRRGKVPARRGIRRRLSRIPQPCATSMNRTR